MELSLILEKLQAGRAKEVGADCYTSDAARCADVAAEICCRRGTSQL